MRLTTLLLILLLTPLPANLAGQTSRKAKTTNTTVAAQTKATPPKTKTKPKTKKQLQREQAEAQRRRREEQQRARQLDRSLRSNLDSLLILDHQLRQGQHTLDSLRTDQQQLLPRIDSLQRRLTQLRRQLRRRQDRYAQGLLHLRQTATIQRRLTFIFSAGSLPQLLRRHRYVREYTAHQHAQGLLIREKQKAATASYNQLLDIQGRLQLNLDRQLHQQQKLQNISTSLRHKSDQLNRHLTATRRLIADYQQREQTIQAEIDRLIQAEIEAERRRQAQAEAERRRKAQAEAERRRQAQAERQQQQEARHDGRRLAPKNTVASPAPGRKTSGPKNTETQATLPETTTFAAAKGRLPIPASGNPTIVRRYGTYNVAGLRGVTLQNHGIDIRTQPGSSALAIHQGRVSGIYQYGGSYIVMLRHGTYISVYSGLRSVSVRTGQTLRGGQPLGIIATDPDGHTSLHLQLRHETQRLDPEQWIKR